MASGKINVSVENIFPLIKKFLYSDHEIFLRELVSNATDATLKLKHLTSIGEAKVEYGHPIIEVKIEYKRNPGIPRKLLPVRAVNRYTKNIEGSLIEMSSIYNDSNNVLVNTKTIYRKQ